MSDDRADYHAADTPVRPCPYVQERIRFWFCVEGRHEFCPGIAWDPQQGDLDCSCSCHDSERRPERG